MFWCRLELNDHVDADVQGTASTNGSSQNKAPQGSTDGVGPHHNLEEGSQLLMWAVDAARPRVTGSYFKGMVACDWASGLPLVSGL